MESGATCRNDGLCSFIVCVKKRPDFYSWLVVSKALDGDEQASSACHNDDPLIRTCDVCFVVPLGDCRRLRCADQIGEHMRFELGRSGATLHVL